MNQRFSGVTLVPYI